MNKNSEDESIIKDIGLLITTYNRPKYVLKTFRSLKKSDLGLLRRIIIVDDGSNSKITLWLIKRFKVNNIRVDVIIKERDGNKIHTSMLKGWNILYKDDQINFICNLDSDTIMEKYWLKELKKIYLREKNGENKILTGFNSNTHPVVDTYEDYYRKRSIGGLNMFFDKEVYTEIILPILESCKRILWDDYLVEKMKEENYYFLCTNPSVIQHIGRKGIWSNYNRYDYAEDF